MKKTTLKTLAEFTIVFAAICIIMGLIVWVAWNTT